MKPVTQQRGVGLASALFVITVMALLAVLITQLVRSNAEAIGEELNLMRAYFAAQSGIEYGLNRAFPPDGDPSDCPAVSPPAVAATASLGSLTFTEQGLSLCTAEIECGTLRVTGKNYYTLTVTGSCGGVSRTLQVRAR